MFDNRKSQLEKRINDLEQTLKQNSNIDHSEIMRSKAGSELINVKVIQSKSFEQDPKVQKNDFVLKSPVLKLNEDKGAKSFANPTYLKNHKSDDKNREPSKQETKQLKLFHMNLGEEDDEKMDKKSLGYKIRKALRNYINK